MGNTRNTNTHRGKVIFNGKYELIEMIGSGGAADVYMAKSLNPEDDTLFAIKIYYRQRLMRHVEDIYKQLDHHTTIKIIESGKDCHIKLH